MATHIGLRRGGEFIMGVPRPWVAQKEFAAA